MFYMRREQQNRANKRNGELLQGSLLKDCSKPKNCQKVFGNNTVFQDLTDKKLNQVLLKQRTPKKEEILPDYFPNFIFGKHQYDHEKINKHLKLMHQGLLYSSMVLGSPSEAYLKHKMVTLPQPEVKKQKILMLDLDQTLIHSVNDDEVAQVELNSSSGVIRFNVRPFCQIFLQTMSKSFQIYVFTSAVEEYAKAIIDHLNQKKKYIEGFLHRGHCLETKRGMKIKDLRIIKNRDLSKIVMVDNLVHCFGLQLQNGIPILQFTNQKEDKQLLGLAKILREIDQVQDVRVFLRQKFELVKCSSYTQQKFLKLNYQKGAAFKERQTIG